MKLPVEIVREYLMYDTETGVFSWIKASSDKSRVGGRAGRARCEGGYRQITLLGQTMYEHRLAWFYANGSCPDGMVIDHINGIKGDNRIANLRVATPTQSMANIGAKRDNNSGCKNVHWCSTKGRWIAKLKRDGKTRHVGTFRIYEDAVEAAVASRIEVFGEFASQLGCEAERC